MSRNTLIILLILSVALNLGLIGTMALRHVVTPETTISPDSFGFHTWLGDGMLDDAQRETIDEIISKNQEEMNDIKNELSQKRFELTELMRQDEPDPDAVELKIAEIADLQRELEQMIAEQMMEVHAVLTPEQAEIFTTHMEERLCPGGGYGMGRGRWDDEYDTDDDFRGKGKGKGWRNQNKNNGSGYGSGKGYCP
ncbi:MAG: periplasmic heavy metal sensor [Deltaproteobacteria bacterium]|nr:periplasmic heavy metal sensor [Candidatus Zymogenaceae bacterium]